MEIRKDLGFMEAPEKRKRDWKQSLLYVYLSIIAHLYLFLIGTMVIDKEMLEQLFSTKNEKKEMVIENIILETYTRSLQEPEKGAISDKPNLDAAPEASVEEVYNYLNQNPSPSAIKSAPQSDGDATEPQIDKNPLVAEGGIQEAIDQETTESTALESIHSMLQPQSDPSLLIADPHTSLFDPRKDVDVFMDSEGDISLATVSEEYAWYFLNMRKKVGASWMNFFPDIQHYLGLLKSGEVEVFFRIDKFGEVHDVRIVHSYGSPVMDNSCLNAVLYAGNFGPLPEGLREQEEVTVNFKFVYVAN